LRVQTEAFKRTGSWEGFTAYNFRDSGLRVVPLLIGLKFAPTHERILNGALRLASHGGQHDRGIAAAGGVRLELAVITINS
jgi:hypothetical protein